MRLHRVHYRSMRQRSRTGLRRPTNNPLHRREDPPQHPLNFAMQLRTVAKPRIDDIDHDIIRRTLHPRRIKPLTKLHEEKQQQQFRRIIPVRRIEIPLLIQRLNNALPRPHSPLPFLQTRPLRRLAPDNRHHG